MTPTNHKPLAVVTGASGGIGYELAKISLRSTATSSWSNASARSGVQWTPWR